jgi:hypothetical protein
MFRRMRTHLPPLITERSKTTEFVILVVGPAVAGIIAGVLLGVSEIGYLVFAILMIAAGYLGGMEHDSALEGFYRGLGGGMQFGVWILITHGVLFDAEPKAELPHPEILLVAVTTVFGCLLGTLGGRKRAQLEQRPAVAR